MNLGLYIHMIYIWSKHAMILCLLFFFSFLSSSSNSNQSIYSWSLIFANKIKLNSFVELLSLCVCVCVRARASVCIWYMMLKFSNFRELNNYWIDFGCILKCKVENESIWCVSFNRLNRRNLRIFRVMSNR